MKTVNKDLRSRNNEMDDRMHQFLIMHTWSRLYKLKKKDPEFEKKYSKIPKETMDILVYYTVDNYLSTLNFSRISMGDYSKYFNEILKTIDAFATIVYSKREVNNMDWRDKKDLVIVKDSNKEGYIEGYIGNNEYVIGFENGVMQMYLEDELDFVNCKPYKDDNEVIKRLITHINNHEKVYDTMDIDNQSFIDAMCEISGLREEEYRQIFKKELEIDMDEELELD